MLLCNVKPVVCVCVCPEIPH